MCKYRSSETRQTQQMFNKNPVRPKHVAAIRVLINKCYVWRECIDLFVQDQGLVFTPFTILHNFLIYTLSFSVYRSLMYFHLSPIMRISFLIYAFFIYAHFVRNRARVGLHV